MNSGVTDPRDWYGYNTFITTNLEYVALQTKQHDRKRIARAEVSGKTLEKLCKDKGTGPVL